MKTQHGGELVDSNIFIASKRFQELATLLSPANMSDKDWARLKRNIIALSEESINDIPFKPSMDVLAEKIGATIAEIESASDDLISDAATATADVATATAEVATATATADAATEETKSETEEKASNGESSIQSIGGSLRNTRKKSRKSKKSVTFKTNIV